ncbi:terpene synthase family protein [Streptomyces sp. NPDC054796]
MPQDVALHIPFLSRISPDFDRARDCHLDWPRAVGLFPTPAAEQRHSQGHYSELAARFHPSATGADLDLAVDQQSWYFLFDDHFDGPRGRDPGYVTTVTTALTAVLDASTCGPPSSDGPPTIRAFADLWARSRDGMSASWRHRAARHWRAYLRSHITEAVNRCQGKVPSFADQLELRMDSIGVAPVLDLAERVGHFEIPERAYHSALLTTMRRVAHEVVIFDNEIVSVEKEETNGDCNLVLQLQRENHCSRSHAIGTISAMVRQRSELFLTLEKQLPELFLQLALDEYQQAALQRYRADALRSMMRGAHDWGRRSERYATRPAAPVPGPLNPPDNRSDRLKPPPDFQGAATHT